MYGDNAKKENDWAFNYLPKIDRKYSWVEQWDAMYSGKVKGVMSFGMNGVAIGPNSQKNIDALKKADWLVVGDIYPDETSSFWESPGISDGRESQDQDGSLPSSLRRFCRKRRYLRELGALAAVEMGCRCRRAMPRWIRKSWLASSWLCARFTRKKAASSRMRF